MSSVGRYRDGYRAQVFVKGVRDSRTFRTKREAASWAGAREVELRAEDGKPIGQKHTLLDAMRKYGKEVSPTKKGRRWEQIRLAAFERTLPINTPIGEVTTYMLAQWRDARLKDIAPSSVVREFTLIAHMFEIARREWGWIAVNPSHDVRRPPLPPGRDTVITRWQIKAMLRVMKYHRGKVRSVSHACACVFLLALRTGMRAGEICSLPWSLVYDDYATVDGKTGVRDVALTPQARRVIEQFRGWDDDFVAGIKTATLDAMFRKYRARSGLSGFTFHDTRHTAATWIAQKLNVLDLCKLFGWSNPRMALVYFNPTASDISKRLSKKVRA